MTDDSESAPLQAAATTPASSSATPAAALPADEARRRRDGLILGIGGYLFWGSMPLIFAAAAPAGAFEILAHRIIWCLVFCALLLAFARGLKRTWDLARKPKIFGTLAAASLFVGINWLVFILGVQAGRVTEVALGYYINPLITVALGIIFLRERLRPLQWTAMGLGLVSVLVITISEGIVPWLGLAVAISFGLYGLVKSKVGSRVGALEGLTIESFILTLPSIVILAVVEANGLGTFTTEGSWHTVLLLLMGPITAIPLLLFSAATRRIPLSWVGMMQYITPTIQFLTALLIFGEHMSRGQWWGFIIIWVTVALIGADSIRAGNRARRAKRAVQNTPNTAGGPEAG
ncbi:EamA family transporter RarD [Brevibacterium sp. HMSC063G07]|uniref:EamA family transporter RarD n=1 Tax=Brevibacterium sp. HMSC063G07 TaxID=1739261 RepID=UPI0008A52256|nr:EamA family transporter RarD [Brevibacterium sp. HMSC063G07]